MVSAFRRLLLVAALALPVLVAATPSTTSPIQLNPRDVPTVPVPLISNKLKQASKPLPSPETNAQRMKRGLGPKMPKFGRSKRSLYPRQSSSPCTSPTGNIHVEYVNDDGATIDGFLGSVPNDFGEYPFFDTQDNALRVQLNNCGSNNAFNILTLVRSHVAAVFFVTLILLVEWYRQPTVSWSHRRLQQRKSFSWSWFFQLCLSWRYL